MESQSPIDSKRAQSKERDIELASKISGGQLLIKMIPGEHLPSYLAAASATGSRVEKIVNEGEMGPFSLRNYKPHPYQDEDGGMHYVVDVGGKEHINIKPGKGYVGVSIEKPKGSEGYDSFWDKLKSLEEEKAQSPSKSNISGQ